MSALCQKRTLALLLDHLVGAHKEGLWDLQAHSLRGLQIHDQLELDRHLHRKIGRLCPTKNLVDVGCGLTIRVGGDVPVGEETTALGIITGGVDCWEAVSLSCSNDQIAMRIHEGARQHYETAVRLACESCDDGFDLGRVVNRRRDGYQAE